MIVRGFSFKCFQTKWIFTKFESLYISFWILEFNDFYYFSQILKKDLAYKWIWIWMVVAKWSLVTYAIRYLRLVMCSDVGRPILLVSSKIGCLILVVCSGMRCLILVMWFGIICSLLFVCFGITCPTLCVMELMENLMFHWDYSVQP